MEAHVCGINKQFFWSLPVLIFLIATDPKIKWSEMRPEPHDILMLKWGAVLAIAMTTAMVLAFLALIWREINRLQAPNGGEPINFLTFLRLLFFGAARHQTS